jgi:hypothetical protein
LSGAVLGVSLKKLVNRDKEEVLVKALKWFLGISLVFTISACSPQQDDNATSVTSQPKEVTSFAGKVTKIDRGKDGSTVELTNETTGEKVYATISIPNLGPNTAFDFSDIKLGRKLEVMGKPFFLGEDRYITANQAKRIE